MRVSRRRFVGSVPVVIAASLAVSGLARAASPPVYTWNGGGTDNNWTTAANWATGSAPPTDGSADAVMAGSTRTSSVVDVPYAVDGLAFGSTAYNFNVSGSTLTIGAGGLTNQGGTVENVANPIVLSADQTWNAGTANGGYLFSKTSVNTNGHALTFAGTNSIVLQGAVTGAGSLTVAGSCQLVNYGTNTYTGGTFVNGGQFYATADAALGAAGSPVTFANGGYLRGINGGTINRDVTLNAGGGQIGGPTAQYATLTLAGPIHGPGSLTLAGGTGGAYIQLTGHNTYTGGTVVNGYTLLGTTDAIQGNVALTNVYAQLQFQQDANGTYAGTVSGGGELIKYGAGIVGLTGNNTYNSDTQLYTGGLEVVAGTGNLSPNSRLIFEGGGGVVQYLGGGTFTRTPGSDVIFNGLGGFSARNGKLTVNLGGAAATIPFDPILGGGAGQLAFGSATADSVAELVNPLALGRGITSPPPTIRVTAGVGGDYALLSGVVSGGNPLNKTGTGTLVLGAVNTFAGGLTVAGGAVQANDGSSLPSAGPLVLNGGVLLGNGTASFTRPLGTSYGGLTVVNWAGSGGFAAAGGTLAVNVGGAAAPLTWGGTNFVPNGSALLLGAARANAPVVFANPIALGSATREVRVDPGLGGDYATLAGGLSGTGGLNKTGAGRLVLAGAGTYTGGTNVAAGSLVVTGSLASPSVIVQAGASLGGTGSIAGGVTIAGGSTLNLVDGTAGTLTLTAPAANLALLLGTSAGGPEQLAFEVGDAADDVRITNGLLIVNPTGGTITVVPIAGLHFGTYDLIDFPAGAATGLANLTLADPDPQNGYTFALRSTATALQLVVVPEPATAAAGAVVLAAACGRGRRSTRPRR